MTLYDVRMSSTQNYQSTQHYEQNTYRNIEDDFNSRLMGPITEVEEDDNMVSTSQ